jgi:glycosyltransferase involved in cell wall biosynthesis
MRAIPLLFRSPAARACFREVRHAYHGQPREAAKACATLVLAAALVPAIQQRHIRHLHAHWATMPALAAYFLKRVSGVPYSITAHAWDIYTSNPLLREKIRAAKFVVTCTAANCKALRSLGARPEQVILCYHGLDFSTLPPPHFAREAALRILAIGRLVEQKGFSFLLKACHLLQQWGVPFHCCIIGEGQLASDLKTLMTQFGLAGAVSLRGAMPQAEIFRAYQWATVFCAPSVIAHDGNRDGIPNVILEAMSQGLPVVASQVSGIPEVIRAGVTGWLVPAQNAHTLAVTLQNIHSAPDEARRRARAAYDFVRTHFDVQTNTDALLHLLWRATSIEPSASLTPHAPVREQVEFHG